MDTKWSSASRSATILALALTTRAGQVSEEAVAALPIRAAPAPRQLAAADLPALTGASLRLVELLAAEAPGRTDGQPMVLEDPMG